MMEHYISSNVFVSREGVSAWLLWILIMFIIGKPLHAIVPKVLRKLSLFDYTSSGSATVMGKKSQHVTKSFIHVTRLVLPSWDITVASTSGISLQR